MKKVIAILLTVVLVLSLAACNTDNLAEYKKASEKTEQKTSGQMSGEFSLVMNFETEGMTAEEIKNLNYFKNMAGSFSAVYDKEAEKGIYRNYISLGGLGFDFDMYMNGKEMFIKLPVVGKYIRLDEMNKVKSSKDNYNKEIMSEESLKAINEKWIGLMKEEDVFKGEDIILTTPDGEVKTTEYTITLSNEQIKTLALESIEIASKDECLRKFYDEYIENANEYIRSFDETIEYIKDNIDDYDIKNFKYTALVDIDGYIVNENIEISTAVADDGLMLTGIDYNFDIKIWDINKDQSFDFPELTEKNTLHTDEMEEMPDVMEDLFKNKN